MDLLLISGSLRTASTNSAVVRTVAELAAGDGRTAVVYEGMAALPHFNPDDDHDPLPFAVADLRARIASAGAILFCTPEYAGELPGSFKNLLDWTVGGVEIEGKPAAWVNAAAPGRGTGASRSLRTVLEYTGGAVVEEACVDVSVARDAVGPDGLIGDPVIRRRLARAVAALVNPAAGRGPRG